MPPKVEPWEPKSIFSPTFFDVRHAPNGKPFPIAIGNGFPLGACLTSKKVGEKMDFGSHGSTFGGNPLACTVGNAVLDIMLKEKFFNEINVVAKKLYEGLHRVFLQQH